ncbi:hypothetical protein SAMN04515674_112109 [Pseudarcicella hirudinis]|uniref:Lipoprotein n=1 Tax=Pseudarcicella hirudinis TaxID=1079859 RepID=A0A1I5WQR6_9BACT|nr:hypothetical protein [Pseudarcicella hirudinis]SFQ21927.1 hypothetical protein SAMN04515674_112109 [Pseudarcicella hirudinis]
MKNVRSLMIVLLGVLTFISCRKDTNDTEPIGKKENSSARIDASQLDEYLVFGYVGLGWGCGTEALYLINGNKLYVDTTGAYCQKGNEYVFNGVQLPDSQYVKAKGMVEFFPEAMRSVSGTTFGCPGCADGGMLFLQLKQKGVALKSWRVDDSVFYRGTDVLNNAFPEYLPKYGLIAFNVIQSLKNK